MKQKSRFFRIVEFLFWFKTLPRADPWGNVSVNSKSDHRPGDPRRFAHSSCPCGSGFRSSVLPGGGGLKLKYSSIIMKKARFLLCLLNKWVAALFICLYMLQVNEQCDVGPIYTITNTQHIRIYPGKLKLVLVKISPDPGRLHGKHAKGNQTLFTFLTTENLSGLFCSHECKYGVYSDLTSYAVTLPG